MATVLLHHYPSSPFAEKMRLLLAFKQMPWVSVMQPPVMPKPHLVALTGGYRRIPVLQVGADVICDTSLISAVIEHLQPEPALAPHPAAALISQWADEQLFNVAMAHHFSAEGVAAFFGTSPENQAQAQAFGADRAAMRGGSPRMAPADATGTSRQYLQQVSALLAQGTYALGGEQPSMADFSLYHPLWFGRHQLPARGELAASFPAVVRWMDHMEQLHHNTEALRSKLSAEQALSVAAQAESSCAADLGLSGPWADDHGFEPGQSVSVTAQSFGLEATVGRLVAATERFISLERTEPELGSVWVHFPRAGFRFKRAE